MSWTSASSTTRPTSSPTIPASPRPRAAKATSPSSTATRAFCSIAAIRSTELADHSNFLEVCYLLLLRRTAEQDADGGSSATPSPITPWCMNRSRSFFRGFRRDAHPMAIMCGVVGALSAFYHDSTDINDPRQREIASHRLIAKMPTHRGHGLQISRRPALRVSAEQAGLHREFPAHVLLRCRRGIQGQSGAGQGAGHDLHPACRSRAERLDLDGAAGGLVGRQSLRLHRGRHRLPVGPRAWRRQRSGAQDAGGDRHRRPHSRICRAARRTRTTPSA